jgi:hypothetical protein
MLRFIEKFFWTVIWIFIALIVGYAILGWGKNIGGPIGRLASWVQNRAEPQ